MKFMIASDIHGSAWYCKKMLEAYEREGAQRLILLGDILYHGPRNDLPKEYNPKQVIAMLNPMKDCIYAVRGNCEAEVDQMVLEFPVLADYGFFLCGSRTIYMSHGHHYNPEHLPPMKEGDVLLYGHTPYMESGENGTVLSGKSRFHFDPKRRKSTKLCCFGGRDIYSQNPGGRRIRKAGAE